MENWHERFKVMKNELGYSNETIAQITGYTSESVKTAIKPSQPFPKWLKLAVVNYERSKGIQYRALGAFTTNQIVKILDRRTLFDGETFREYFTFNS